MLFRSAGDSSRICSPRPVRPAVSTRSCLISGTASAAGRTSYFHDGWNDSKRSWRGSAPLAVPTTEAQTTLTRTIAQTMENAGRAVHAQRDPIGIIREAVSPMKSVSTAAAGRSTNEFGPSRDEFLMLAVATVLRKRRGVRRPIPRL